MSSLLNKLNACGNYVKFIKLSDLEIGREYLTSHYEIINTKYGNKLAVTLDMKFKIFLPDKYLHIFSDGNEIENANSNNFKIVYNGKKTLSNSYVFHDISFSQ